MISTKYPNRDTIYKAHTIYRDAMRRFIINCLKKKGKAPEKLIGEELTRDQNDPTTLHNEIEAMEAMDIDNFPHLIRKFWDSPVLLSEEFNSDRVIWNETELIKDNRPCWAHPGTKDTEPDVTLKLLLLVRDVLGKINAPDEKREVESIRDQLFSHDNEEHLAVMSNQLETAETDLATLKAQLVTTEKRLAVSEKEKTAAEEQLADISAIVAAESFRESNDERKIRDTSDEQFNPEPIQKHTEISSSLKVGQWINGKVKNVAAFGAFVDLDGVDGLIRKPNLTWEHINNPKDVVSIGDEVRVKIINIDQETEEGKTRIDLRLKPDPWEDSDIQNKYLIGSTVQGTVTGIQDYGVFLKLEEGLTGMIHKSDLSWKPNDIAPSDFNQGDEINTIVLEVSKKDKRISLGLKSLQPNPWELVEEQYPVGTKITGPVVNVTSFGVFVEIEPGINGLIRMPSPETLTEGDEVEAIISDINVVKQQITLYRSTGIDSGRRI